jgi:CheY-like chemotaxis protein
LREDAKVMSTQSRVTDAAARHPHFVLIVEDNPDGRESLRMLLQMYGHTVAVAADGIEGVEKAIELRPDVVLIDIGLPGIDGYEVARRLREAFGHDVRLIACTAYSDPSMRQRAFDVGFDEFQVKPMDLEELLAHLEE